MDQADDELKETIKNIWPLQAKNMVDLLVPPTDQLNTGKLTVGKIYGGLLILESWRSTRFGQMEPSGLPVRETLNKKLVLQREETIKLVAKSKQTIKDTKEKGLVSWWIELKKKIVTSSCVNWICKGSRKTHLDCCSGPEIMFTAVPRPLKPPSKQINSHTKRTLTESD